MSEKNSSTENIGYRDIKKAISKYLHKCEKKRKRKKYEIRYAHQNGKFKKVKVRYDELHVLNDDDPILTPPPPCEKTESPEEAKARKKAESKAAAAARRADLKAKARKWKHRHGDRIDGRRLHTISGMMRFMPFVMRDRNDALNTYADSFDITEVEKYCRGKVKSGMSNFSMLHVLLAAYVRVVSQKPGVNRFVSGQEIYSRYTIDVVMTVKKYLAADAPDTCIKVIFEPTDTVDDVYRKFNKVVEASIGDNSDTDFDSFSGALLKIPRWILRFFVWLLNKLDYHGKMPLALLDISPFHGSMIITSMGSLGIKPIYHHIYNFGNLPVFLAYGMKRTVIGYDKNGEISRKRYIDFKVVTDERICDGFYYASAFKLMKKLVESPEALETPPEKVYDDIL